MSTEIETFADFWPYYLRAHRNPLNRRLHFVGTSLAVMLLLSGFLLGPWMVLTAVVAGYGFAWTGHVAVEGNKPATFGHPFYSLAADFRMWSHMLKGTLNPELLNAGVDVPMG